MGACCARQLVHPPDALSPEAWLTGAPRCASKPENAQAEDAAIGLVAVVAGRLRGNRGPIGWCLGTFLLLFTAWSSPGGRARKAMHGVSSFGAVRWWWWGPKLSFLRMANMAIG